MTDQPDILPDILGSESAGPKAVRGGISRVAAFGIGAAVSAIAAAILFRHLGVDDTGRYGLILSLVALVGGISDMGMTAIGVRDLASKGRDEAAAMARSLLGLRIVLGIGGLALAVAYVAVAGYPEEVLSGVLLAGTAMLFHTIQDNYGMSLQADLRLGWVAAADVTRQVITACLVLLAVAAGLGLVPITAAGIPATGVVLVTTIVLVRGRIPITPSFQPSRWRPFLKSILPYSLAVLSSAIYFRLGVLAVSLLCSAEQLGYFNAAFRIIEILIAVPVLLVGAAFPIFARSAKEGGDRLAYGVSRVLHSALLIGGLVIVGLTLGAPIAIAVIGGPDFKPAAEVLAIQSVAVAAAFVGSVYSYTLLSLDRERDLLKLNGLVLALGGGLEILLIAVDGIRGAAVGMGITQVFAAVLCGYLASRHRPGLVPPLSLMLKIALAVGLAFATSLIGLAVIPTTLIGVALYCATVISLRAVPDELVHAFRELRS